MKNKGLLVLVSLLVAAMLALVGCGDGGSKESTSDSTDTTVSDNNTADAGDGDEDADTDEDEGSGSDEASTGIPSDLVGHWVQTDGTNEYVINADGTGSVTMAGTTLDVTWEVSGDSFSYAIEGGAPNQYTYKLSGDTLTTTDPLGTNIDYARQ